MSVDEEPPSARASRAARRSTTWLGTASAVVIGAIALALGGCEGAPRGGEPDPAESGGAAPLIAALAAQLADANGSELADDTAAGPITTPSWPADLRFHPDARAESIELLAVLRDGEGAMYSFARQFARFRLRAGGRERAPVSGDDFAFDEVIRLSGRLDRAGGGGGGREALERMTLGLAEGGTGEVRVRDAVLTLEPASGTVERCALDRVLEEGDGLSLRLTQRGCPSATVVGGALVLATSPTLAVEGRLVVEGSRREVVGSGWVRHAWGDVPAPGGAVVFDRVLLELDGVGLIEAARSKRRSGRGPTTVTASVATAEGESVPLDGAVYWRDGDDEENDEGDDGGERQTEVPRFWSFGSPPAGIDIVLEPVAEGAVAADLLGRTWRGAVLARGSHEGRGFVEFVVTGQAAVGAP